MFKPRDQWHTFWNAGDEPARILEIIAPAGFEGFFAKLSEAGGVAEPPEPAEAGGPGGRVRARARHGERARACASASGVSFGPE